MLDRLREGPGQGCVVRSFESKDYPDTKIKLHFSHFKILVSGRTLRQPSPFPSGVQSRPPFIPIREQR